MRANKVFSVIAIRPFRLAEQIPGRQCRIVVAAPTQVRALQAFNAAGFSVTAYELRNYGGVTGNATEMAVATESPGTVFAGTLNGQPSELTAVPAQSPA